METKNPIIIRINKNKKYFLKRIGLVLSNNTGRESVSIIPMITRENFTKTQAAIYDAASATGNSIFAKILSQYCNKINTAEIIIYPKNDDTILRKEILCCNSLFTFSSLKNFFQKNI